MLKLIKASTIASGFILLLSACNSTHFSSDSKLRTSDITTENLCYKYHDFNLENVNNDSYKRITAELEKRNVLKDSEWALTKSHKISKGMTVMTVKCSLGKPDRNVYGDNDTLILTYNNNYPKYIYFKDYFVIDAN